jgi:hypothetical protein
VGEVTVLPAVAEGAPYTELAVKDSEEAGAWGKYGGYVGLTLEMFERDETHNCASIHANWPRQPCGVSPRWWGASSPKTAASARNVRHLQGL